MGCTSSCASQLEQELLFGGLSTADVPDAWNARMEELVGVRPPNDRLGCLQDVHWSGGMFGYFPTYQLGNILSAQIWERLVSDIPDAYELVEQGSFDAIYEWLREHLYRHGRKFAPAAMIERLVGGPIDPEPYLRYLADKNASLATA